MELQKATGFLKNAYYQGHGRYVNQIARMTLKFCKSSGGSREVRKFIETRLVDIARENPGCVIYVKPRLFKSPAITTKYLNGGEHYLNLHRMSSAQIEAWINWHLTRSGEELYKIFEREATSRPSVQGMWNPFKFRDPATNVTEFPSEQLGSHISKRPSATEQLESLYKQTQAQAQQSSQ